MYVCKKNIWQAFADASTHLGGFSRECLEAPSPPPTTTTTATAIDSTTATSPATSLVLLAILRFGGVIHEERIKWKRVRENKVADIVATDGQGVQ